MSAKEVILITEPLDTQAVDWLRERFHIEQHSSDTSEFHSILPDAAALVVRTYTRVDESLLARAKSLRVVGRAGAGIDNIDAQACRKRNIDVVYTPDANTQAVVEYVMCLMGDALRPRIQVRSVLDQAEWRFVREEITLPRQFSEMTLGILGLGRVGKRIAEVASAIGMKTKYNDLVEIEEPERFGAQSVSAQQLFAQSDVLSIHIDGRRSNAGFVGRSLIELMKLKVVFINTSRGFIVDNFALADFLNMNPNALAMLDVHEPEPFGIDYPMLNLPNARLYPHLGAKTEAAMRNMSWVVRDVAAVLEGRPPEFSAPFET